MAKAKWNNCHHPELADILSFVHKDNVVSVSERGDWTRALLKAAQQLEPARSKLDSWYLCRQVASRTLVHKQGGEGVVCTPFGAATHFIFDHVDEAEPCGYGVGGRRYPPVPVFIEDSRASGLPSRPCLT
ncbi:hypothetical protein Baya_16062 [Bagarius yarrelli]|uniref:Uncharacterized protein n=1 Tax=Bagarius yarrelli TaxID=175774 RepID=A0A556VUH8_BAGYA|nr:hypothetical protein Baya_16062 [Bagarius yarrelli]